jgi:hypothetical protein
MVKYSPAIAKNPFKYLKMIMFQTDKRLKNPTMPLCRKRAAVRRRLGAFKIHA